MADEAFQIGIAVGLQSAFGAINGTIRDLGVTLSSTDGIILGDKEAGDFESGISIPNFVKAVREVADVAGSLTPSAPAHLFVTQALQLVEEFGNGEVEPAVVQVDTRKRLLVGVARYDHARALTKDRLEERLAQRRSLALEARAPYGVRIGGRALVRRSPEQGSPGVAVTQRAAERLVEHDWHQARDLRVLGHAVRERLLERLAAVLRRGPQRRC